MSSKSRRIRRQRSSGSAATTARDLRLCPSLRGAFFCSRCIDNLCAARYNTRHVSTI